MNLYKSIYTANKTPVHVSDKMTGKMELIPAISTSVALNPICAERAKNPDSICHECFAVATVNRYTNLAKNLEENTATLTGSILPAELLPKFKVGVQLVRFEAFGDLNNTTQVFNYFNIAANNPHCSFALWTKNPHIIAAAIAAGAVKPNNLVIVYSSPLKNFAAEYMLKKYDFIDKVFTVYAPDYIAENGVEINCGARDCFSCRRCYSKDTEKIVNEKLK